MPHITVPEAFPSDDPVGLFVVAMAMAGNDVEYGLRQAVAANPDGPEKAEANLRRRFSFWVRVTNGFLFEGIDALRAWQQNEAGVVKLLSSLEPEGREKLKVVRGLEQKIGSKTLSHVRQNTFHFPHPDPGKTPDSAQELAEVIDDSHDLIAGIDIGEDAEHTFRFADPVAVRLALRRHDDPETQIEKIRDGAMAFVGLAQHVHYAYAKQRGIGFEVVED